MPRPSQNIDQRLLAAGMELLPQTGCRGLSTRKLTEHAGVNLGMFHYHFRSKDNFIRTLLQQTYEQMFQDLVVLQSHEGVSPVDNLRKAVRVIAGFGRTHRQLLLRIGADALAGEQVAAEFLQTNLPRHMAVVAALVAEAQRKGELVKAPLPQVIAFLAGAVMSPVLLGTALLENGQWAMAAGVLEQTVLSKKAVEQRIEFALRGLSARQGEAP
ncbi:TetR/AcrR family transcriptional regulator [Noviherbaspirillum denitrificans]|uniref:TetR family transcriptional regulator n=1 Tax=Noviherbaspirillum denitrificans TaxID=1968433 RepID=A0A254TJ97_9BURK|nr:TetR/AcrR family transcriptional regulator [Noviherbaspirillum denitrificans]OWW22644.1 TetR family transcriptional regulator [Noviherbaspirillum denitrificans]